MPKNDVIVKIDARSIDLGELVDYEQSLEKHGITFDTGTEYDGKGIPKVREWQLDWAWKAPKGATRDSVIRDLRKRFPNTKIKVERA